MSTVAGTVTATTNTADPAQADPAQADAPPIDPKPADPEPLGPASEDSAASAKPTSAYPSPAYLQLTHNNMPYGSQELNQALKRLLGQTQDPNEKMFGASATATRSAQPPREQQFQHSDAAAIANRDYSSLASPQMLDNGDIPDLTAVPKVPVKPWHQHLRIHVRNEQIKDL